MKLRKITEVYISVSEVGGGCQRRVGRKEEEEKQKEIFYFNTLTYN